MPNTKELYKVTHSSPELNTVGEYLFDLNSPAHMYEDVPDTFLKIVGEDDLTNRQRIEATYKTPEEKEFIGKDANSLPLKVGTVLYLEYDKVNSVSWVTEGIEVVSNDDVAFKASRIAELEADQGYVQVVKPIKGELAKGTVKETYPACTVWIWCRAISPQVDEDTDLTGQFFDLTPFIENMVTNVGKNGGNFTISLPPLVAQLDQENKWVIKKESMLQFNNGEYLADDSYFNTDNGELQQNRFLFHNIIRPNDLIFIRFETLDIDKEQRYKDAQEYYIDKNNLANRIYDMIGLVDDNIQITSAENNDVRINIAGRDLSKLFIEDGTYFYALENSQGLLKFAGQSTQKNTQINRIIGDGAMAFIGLYQFTSIEYILKFIIQQLANIQLVPSDLFSSYAHSVKVENGVQKIYDARNKRFNQTENNPYHFLPNSDTNTYKLLPKYKKPYQEDLANGIWQIVKLVIDESVTGRRLADSSMSTAQGSLLNFIRSAAQEPLVEFFMDTYKDQYHLIVRKPPYDQKSIISMIEGKVKTEDGSVKTPPAIIDIEAEDVIQEHLSMDDSQVYSWYSFLPKNNMIGDANAYSLSYLGALYFEEFAQVFGSKPMQLTHPYMAYIPKNTRGGEGLDLLEKQAALDYKYLIESTQYLPFTRKGRLVLNGDRRLKIGNIIRYKPTGEIFFIDSVQQKIQINENSIERTSTVSVSRGMIEQLIYGIHLQNEQGATRFVSYFNIIDTRLVFEDKDYQAPYTVKEKVDTRVVGKRTIAPQPSDAGADSFFTNQNTGVTDFGIDNPFMVRGSQYFEKYTEPYFKNLFIHFVNTIVKAGFEVTLVQYSTNRTHAEQAYLKAKNPLNASVYNSRHEYNHAIDINIRDPRTGKYYGKETDEAVWRTTGIPQIANSLGLRWGGEANNGTFGTKGQKGYYVDRVHFEFIEAGSEGGSEDITENIFDEVTKYKPVRGLNREIIFRNFKVNKFTFNFFLKNLQFDPALRVVKNRQVFNSDQEGSLIDVTVKATKTNAGK